MPTFDVSRFSKVDPNATKQYQRQIQRLIEAGKEVQSIEVAVQGTIRNLDDDRRSFVIYGEPQSGKTEMMICLTAKLLDSGFETIVHLLNDSVDLLEQNLGRFKESGLAPAAKNFSEVLDPAVKVRGQRCVIFCKKNGSDLRKLNDKLDGLEGIVVIDDEADYASPNAKVNAGARTPINDHIRTILGDRGTYIGVTATPARLDLNNTFDNDSNAWVDFPPHSRYTGQDVFFPLDSRIKYQRTLLPDSGGDPKYARQALFSFLVNVAYLNLHVTGSEKNYSMLVHTSGKKVDHKSDWNILHKTLETLVSRAGEDFTKYAESIWTTCRDRYPDADVDQVTHYILGNISRNAIVILNSERDWKNNSSAATNPTSLFTIIIGGNIVSRGVTLNNLLSMFFTRDVKHKIQQDTYIQRARMFGSRETYLRFFELTIPQTLYADWHRCFMFHRLALSAIKEGLGSLVWVGDNRISAVASNSIDRSTVDLDRGEMSFGTFEMSQDVISALSSKDTMEQKLTELQSLLGEKVLPTYLVAFIDRTSIGARGALHIHAPIDISGYGADTDMENLARKRGFIGTNQLAKAPSTTAHHVFVIHNGNGRARLIYKFKGSIQFIKNLAHDS
jgi:hypothetical protein